ncbi:TPA: hypothetical protein NBK09_005035 [Klebsiella pneumoniae]|nr:hypothetical protein [Klebsiella pneumoniae]
MNIETVNELIRSLESAGELSIREQKFLKLAKAYQQLAAENVGMDGFVEEMLAIAWQGGSTDGSDIQELALKHGLIRQEVYCADKHENCVYDPGNFDDGDAVYFRTETPATDRIVAGIKADGVEEFVRRLQQCVDEGDFVGDEVAVIVGAIDCGKEFCEQLREGAEK